MTTKQSKLIRQAYEKYGVIYPINGSSFSDKHFTEHTDKNNIAWLFFWYHDINMSARIERQRVSCPNCAGELRFSDINSNGDCDCLH